MWCVMIEREVDVEKGDFFWGGKFVYLSKDKCFGGWELLFEEVN